MKVTYSITGMTCTGCQASVRDALLSIKGVKDVKVDLDHHTAEISSDSLVAMNELVRVLTPKYKISKKADNIFSSEVEEESKLQQLKPLFLIFFYLFVSAGLLNFRSFTIDAYMLDFMGLFFIVFSFFKILDLKGFPQTFQMYDPLAKVLPAYGWVYPFIEVALGIMLLMRLETGVALLVTLGILLITTVGVSMTLLSGKKIKCACLGTALNLPMTEATFIENAIMIVMAGFMLLKGGLL